MEANLENFPKELAHKIQEGRRAGLTEQQISEGIVHLGDVMAKFVRPDSPEESLMRQMWKISTDEEKRMMANLVVRMSNEPPLRVTS
ncbi:MAG: DUF3243 family protein [Desulforudis sp.]|jgi:hypothetical protein|nr:DUF3243 family protein [Clostridia bacterium]MDQ7791065.1 DUF3243 family protein [Clostridia bacterium]RJX17884.1 MAG: DUF3243 family protein [Desulforudis sp.]